MGYKTICPICGRNNYYITPHNGKEFCFNCGKFHITDGKRIKEERYENIKDIRIYYNKMTNYYYECLGQEHRNFLYSRGIDDKTINELKIGFCPSGYDERYKTQIARISGLSINNETGLLHERIVFPYLLGKDVIDIRGRTICNHEKKYLSPKNGSYYRGADYPFLQHTISDEETIILTEGEIKAIIPYMHGYKIVSIPGMNTWRYGFITDARVIILFDNQRNHKRELFRATCNAAKRLENPYVATLPLFGKDKQDIDSFIASYGIESFDLVIQSALPFVKWKELQ